MVHAPATTRRWTLAAILAFPLFLHADDSEGIAFFEKEIRPLLVTHCYECHANGETNGGLSLESRGAILRGGDTGPAAIPNQVDQSLLIEAVRYTREELKMPPSAAFAMPTSRCWRSGFRSACPILARNRPQPRRRLME